MVYLLDSKIRDCSAKCNTGLSAAIAVARQSALIPLFRRQGTHRSLTGLDELLKVNTYAGEDDMMRNKATGNMPRSIKRALHSAICLFDCSSH